MGLETASSGLQSALRVVESGDRTTPQQAMEVYQMSEKAANSRIEEWKMLKSEGLAEFNRALEKAGLKAIQVSAIEKDSYDLLAQ
jgi:hypothetical protein